ncbi:phosphatase PAP2 family protein, partial [Actinosynnema sp.]|uniref:phosphatase PAP2 family protein n=1 Tax=Actinosynnema sp. TaxID=1872144 RepID=UPI003F84A52E
MPRLWGGGHLLGAGFAAPWDAGLSERICSARAGDAALDSLFRVISALGNPAPVTGLAVLSCCCALLLGRSSAGLVLLAVPWLASLACGALKDVVTRPRPGFGCVAAAQTGFSFPSAHAVGATTGLLLVALVLPAAVLPAGVPPTAVRCAAARPVAGVAAAARRGTRRAAPAILVARGVAARGVAVRGAAVRGVAVRCAAAGCAAAARPAASASALAVVLAPVLAEAVSFSRVALGAHYLTDLLFGQAFGAGWAWLGVRALVVTGAGSRAPTA